MWRIVCDDPCADLTYPLGDSSCHFSSFSANGTLTGRVALTGERESYASLTDSISSDAQDEAEKGQCARADSGGIGRMNRIGQVHS